MPGVLELGKDIMVLNIENTFDKVLIKITRFRDQLHHRNCHFYQQRAITHVITQ